MREFNTCSVRTGLIVLATLLVLAPMANAYTITLNGAGTSNFWTRANDDSGGYIVETVYPAALSYSNSSTVIEGATTNTTTFDLTNAEFNIAFDHTRENTYFIVSTWEKWTHLQVRSTWGRIGA